MELETLFKREGIVDSEYHRNKTRKTNHPSLIQSSGVAFFRAQTSKAVDAALSGLVLLKMASR